MKRRIYADTSVFGGYFDEEFQGASRPLFDRFRAGEDVLVLSDLTELELQEAPSRVRELLDLLPDDSVESVEFTDSARKLAELYISAGVVGRSTVLDAQHIATATLHRVDVLVSWNFRHIVNLARIHAFNSVNLREGFPLLEIRTPKEVLEYG
jgi:predicted nucleic acid-binding protein